MMKVTKRLVTVRELVNGFSDKQEEGVTSLEGKLNIRPSYQREFIYKQPQQEAVIESILGGMPLNTMYWSLNEDGTYEVLDGQQRTISICRFVTESFALKYDFFFNLSVSDQNKILDYELDIYICEGDTADKIKWFQRINISGESLTNQELLNAIFNGPWVTDAKRYFSRIGCPAHTIGSNYVNGTTIRQELLETAIKWASDKNVEQYMIDHRKDLDARPLWDHFNTVIHWVEKTFIEPRPKLMRGLNWGLLYNETKDKKFHPIEMENEIQRLLLDEEITNQKGIYIYLLTGNMRFLHLRSFPEIVKRRVYTKQGGICPHCNKKFDIRNMEADHIIPWSKNGTTVEENCQMLCKKCNRTKGGK
ncbi:MAG: HNH endonuclease family protein [Bacteroidales bacterium]